MSEESNFYELNLSTSNHDIIFDDDISLKSKISLSDNPQNIPENQQQHSIFQENVEDLSTNNNNDELSPKNHETTKINQNKSFAHFSPFISFDFNFTRKSILSRNSYFPNLEAKNASMKNKSRSQENLPIQNADWGSVSSTSFEYPVDEALFTPVSLHHKIEFSPTVLKTKNESDEENSIQHEIQQFLNPGETFIKLKAKKHLNHNFINQKLQNSGLITSFRMLSYTSFIVQFATHTMATHAMNIINSPTFMNRKENPNQIQYKATIKTEEEINGLLEKRQHDIDTTFSPPKCLCVHGLDPKIDNIEKLMRPFTLEDTYEISEKNGEVTVYTYHLNAASVKDFLSAFQDNLSGVPNTYITEEPNRKIIQKISEILKEKLICDCIKDVKKMLAEDVIGYAINRTLHENAFNISVMQKMNRLASCKSLPLVQPDISMPSKTAQNLQDVQNETQIKRSSSNPLDFYNSGYTNFQNSEFGYTNNANQVFGQFSQLQQPPPPQQQQQIYGYQQMQGNAMQSMQIENQQNLQFQPIMQQQQHPQFAMQPYNQGQFMNYSGMFYPTVQQQQPPPPPQQQQANPYILSSSSSFPNQNQLFIQQNQPHQTQENQHLNHRHHHHHHYQQQEQQHQEHEKQQKPSKSQKQQKQARFKQKDKDQFYTNKLIAKHVDEKSFSQPNQLKLYESPKSQRTVESDENMQRSPTPSTEPETTEPETTFYNENNHYLNFYLGSRSNLIFFLSNPRSNFSSLVRSEAKRRKKQLLSSGSDARNYERQMTKQMEQETTFESIKQPSIENNSSRLTPIHKIEEWHKRVYLRPYASMRRKKYVVARKSGLPILKSQFSENMNENSAKKGTVGKRVYFEKSEIQGYGLFALEPISPKDFICEYTGQLIRMEVADRREKKLSKKGFQHMYLFRLGQMVIDATEHGSNARFLNHSCSPNCRARQITIKDMQSISFFATKTIKPHDEIAFNYEMELESDPSKWEKCYCGSKDCNGYLNYSFRRSTLNKMWMQANNLDENSDDSA